MTTQHIADHQRTIPAHTPGPLHIQQDSEWPYTIRICTQAGEAVHSEPLACSSSHWKSLDDARDLVGIRSADRQAWKNAMDRQMADMHLRAAAPELLEALVQCEMYFACLSGMTVDDAQDAMDVVRAAIAKARGEA